MKTKFKKLALYSAIVTGGFFLTLSSCKKDNALMEKPQKLSTFSGTVSIDQAWIDLRDKARNEYDFYFGSYYHTRDILKDVDWDKAILSYDGNGNRVMVFLMERNEEIPTDARLMAVQEPGGETRYSIRLKSKETDYTSVYSAKNKMLYVGTTSTDNVFTPVGRMELKGTVVIGASLCDGCHSGDGEDYPGGGGGGTYPGTGGGTGGSIWDNNLLDEVTIVDDYPTTIWPIWPDQNWEGPIVIFPGGGSNTTVDNDPCATFNNLMNDPAIRSILQQLINNTTLNKETAFTYNGATFSPWAYGADNGNGVTITIPPDAVLQGHSHYNTNQYGTFSADDLNALYTVFPTLNNPLNFAMVIATPGGGVDILKIVNTTDFSAFGANYLANGNYSATLEPMYNWYGVGTGSGASATLQTLLDATNSGLRIFHVPNPDQGSSGNPCQ